MDSDPPFVTQSQMMQLDENIPPFTLEEGHDQAERASSSSNTQGEALPPLEGAIVDLQVDEDHSLDLAKRTLIGKVLTDKPINKNALKIVIPKAWNAQSEIQMTDMGINGLLFTFPDEDKARKVLEDGPWSVMGSILSLQPWEPQKSVFEVKFNLIPFWVQIHGLPLDVMNVKNVSKIASLIGEILLVENPLVEGKLLRTFFRVKVLVNTSLPLSTGFWVPRKHLNKVWVFLRYEKLQGFCYNCGLIGHEQRLCKVPRATTSFNPSLPRYTQTLGVTSARSLASIVAERKQGQRSNPPSEPTWQDDRNKPESSQPSAELRYWKKKLGPKETMPTHFEAPQKEKAPETGRGNKER